MASQDKSREERLAAALRENLRRRKAHKRDGPDSDQAEPASGAARDAANREPPA